MDENVPDDTDVIILVDAQGEIVNCIDARRCRTLRHIFMVQHSPPHLRLLSSQDDEEDPMTIQPLATIEVAPQSECLLFDMYNNAPSHVFGIDEDAYCEGFLMTEISGKNGEVLDDRLFYNMQFEMVTSCII